MAVRTLSAVFDVDTGQFSVKIKDAIGRLREVKIAMNEVATSTKTTASALGGSVQQLLNYSKKLKDAEITTEALTAAQNRFILSLDNQLETMGKSEEEMLLYRAGQLGIEKQTRATIEEISRQSKALREQAEATALAARASEEAAMIERNRSEAAMALTNSLREQIVELRGGREALTMERAAMLGCEEEARALSEQIAILNREHAEAASIMKAFAEAEDMSARESSKAAVGMRALKVETDSMTRSAHMGGRAIYELNVLTHELSSGRIRQAISSFSILLSNIGLASGAVLGLTLSIGILYGMSKPIEAAAKHMEELKKQSQELGISISELQRLTVASDLLGVKNDKLVSGMARLDNQFAKARQGSKLAKDGFDALGVSLNKNYTSQELLQGVLKGWEKLADGPRKVTVAMELFGRSGKDLIPILDKLQSDMGQVDYLAAHYGLVNEQAAANGALLAEKFREAGLATQGLGLAFMQTFGPALIGLINGMGNLTRSFGLFIKDGQGLKEMMKGLTVVVVALGAYFAGPWIASMATAMVSAMAFEGINFTLAGSFQFLAIQAMTAGKVIVAALLNPITIIAAAAAGFIYLQSKINGAREAASTAVGVHQQLSGALEQAASFAAKYHLNTDSLNKAMGILTGSTKDGITATDEATRAAQIRAKAEEELKNSIMLRAIADGKAAEIKLRSDAQGADFAGHLEQFQQNALGNTLGLNGKQKQKEAADAINAQFGVAKAAREAADAIHREVSATEMAQKNGPKLDLKSVKPTLVGSTAGDNFKTGKSKDPNKRIEEMIRQANAQIAGASAWDQSEDPGKTARASLQSKIDGGEFKGADPRKLEELLNLTERAAIAKDHENKSMAAYKAILGDVAKAQLAAKDALLLSTIPANKFEASIAKLNDDLDKNRAILIANNPELQKNSDQLKKLDENIATGKAANRVKVLADYLEGLREQLRVINAEAGAPKAMDGIIKRNQDTKQAKEAAARGGDPYNLQQGMLQKATDALNAGDMKQQLIKANEAAQKIEESLMQVDQAREAAHEREMARINREFDLRVLTENLAGDALTNAIATRDKLRQAENDKFARDAETPAQKIARDWQDTTTAMKTSQGKWMTDFVSQLEQGKFSFTSFAAEILTDVLSTFLKAKAAALLQPMFDGLGNILGSGISSILGMGGASQAVSLASSAIGAGGGFMPPMFHSGGVVGSEGPAYGMVHPSVFAGASKYHTGGMAGLKPDEVPAILQKGEGVFTKEQMKSMGGGTSIAPPVVVNLNNQSGMQLEGDHSGTHFDGEKYIVDVIVSHLNQPGKLRTAINMGK